MGDFNLDTSKQFNANYAHKDLFTDFENELGGQNLIQMVKFKTWSRVVNNVLKESTLDHVYVKDPTLILAINSVEPPFGDHKLIYFDIDHKNSEPERLLKRDYRLYSKDLLCNELAKENWSFDIEPVQEYWNVFENKLINIIDKIIPIASFGANNLIETPTPKIIKK